MLKPNWTHTITPTVGDARVVTPSGDWELAIKGAWEDFPFCRDYRLKVEGEMIFSGDDYSWIIAQECYDRLNYEIKCNGIVFWNGFISFPFDFEINEDLCTAIGEPRPNDKYSIFDGEADTEYEFEDDDFVVAWEDMPPGTDTWHCHDHASLVYNITHELLEDTVGLAASVAQPLSTFFWNDIEPDTTNIGTHNYVTANDPNELNLLGFIMADEVANNTDPAYPDMSWNDWMTILHNFFNVWWYIDDEDDKIRIEHIRWWEGFWFGAGDNLTTLDGGTWIENSSKYKFQLDQVPRSEWWRNADTILAGNDFRRSTGLILYPTDAFNPNQYYQKVYPLDEIKTDVEYTSIMVADCCDDQYMFLHLLDYTDYLWTDPGNTAPDGIARPNLPTACTGVPPDYVIWYEAGAITAANHVNAHMAMSNIVTAYWYRWRPQLHGVTFAGAVTFDSQEPLYLQSELAYPKCCVFGDNEFQSQIVTQYGNGYIRAGSLTQEGMLAKLELLHTITCV